MVANRGRFVYISKRLAVAGDDATNASASNGPIEFEMADTHDTGVRKRKSASGRARSTCAVILCSGLCATAILACGSSNRSSPPAARVEEAGEGTDAGQCPASVALTIGAPCQGDGLLCAPSYDCDLVEVPLLCTCTGGFFACTDGAGNAVDAGETPGCAAPAAVDASCPLDEESATAAACFDVGLICGYRSACGVGMDSCECMNGSLVTGGPSLVFGCQLAACGPSDAGGGDGEGGSDAALEALPSLDAGVSE